ncbi:two-component system sensor histidine kinase AgrC [Breznakia sp. PF5-3]|uniref:sensor histidine kinase n=1 Tax=unclassified Breznakia TaxID=2623764 RepID=UPI00240653D5|nr:MULTISPECIES: sensor histidine kinase [unclassified Breznakia]MDF9823783.1 two-component system sensor histidine kinase AgrC [Breznakia sp. PM6-1]MDF9834651.1 two-component system sensor histidine kinase AgrC [Breznakia sp. PF5-3]MDF9836732.1 two-component system sensor histidine kinase AgrC [Breznakia sp. PFB2-8]MDF9858819.1 two-component system sensor histidine kinase AgrC [Breznakia sp. PH5-24]
MEMLIKFLRLFLGYFIQIVPCFYLVFIPFRSRKELSKKVVMRACVILMIGAVLFSVGGLLSYYVTGKNIIVNYLFIAIAIVVFICIEAPIKVPFFEKLFIALLVSHYAIIVSTISNYVLYANIMNLPNSSDRFANGLVDLWIILIVTVITLPFVSKFISVIVRKIPLKLSEETWRKLCFLPLTLTIISILSFAMTRAMEFNKFTVASFAMIFICILSTYYLTFVLLQQYRKNVILEIEAEVMDVQLQLHNQGYNQLVEKMDQFRKVKHDFIHHMRAIDALAQAQESEKIREYIEGYLNNQYFLENIKYCMNAEIDLLMRYYAGMAKAESIPIDIKLDIQRAIHISVADISIVLGNCIENAIQANKDVDESKRMLRVRGSQEEETLVFTIDNAYAGSVIEKEGKLISTKHRQDAIGISSVQAILKKYNGILKYSYDDKYFYISIFIGKE